MAVNTLQAFERNILNDKNKIREAIPRALHLHLVSEAVSSLPRPVVRLDYPLLSRQKLGALVIRAVVLLLVGACGFWIGRSDKRFADGPPEESGVPHRSLAPRTADKPRPQQMAEFVELGGMLSGYAANIPIGGITSGPRIVGFDVRLPVTRSGQLNYILAAESNGRPYQGQLSFDIAGLRNGRMEVLRAPSTEAVVVGPERLKLSFNRYVRTEGAVLLPPGFTPFLVGASLPSPGSGELKKLACPV